MKNLTNEQIQVILTATFGDGHIRKKAKNRSSYFTSSKIKANIDLKHRLLGDLGGEIMYSDTNGYSGTYIWTYRSKSCEAIVDINNMILVDKMNLMDELGLTMWLLDDGSRHKRNGFYNINSHSFNEVENYYLAHNLREKFGVFAKVLSETKADGRKFYYLHVPRAGGAYKLSKLIEKSGVEEYAYKCLPKEECYLLERISKLATDNGFKGGTEDHFKECKRLGRKIKIF